MKGSTSAERKKYSRQYILIAILGIVVLFLISIPTLWYVNCKIESRAVLSEAKNVELAIRLFSTDAYGYGATIYDASQEDGMNREYAEKIRTYSGAKGTTYITLWNKQNNKVEQFHYDTGSYTVYYVYDFDKGSEAWNVEYHMNILQYHS